MGEGGEPHSRVLDDVVHEGDDGRPLCCCMLVNEPTGAIFCHDELWRGRGPVNPSLEPLFGWSQRKPPQKLR